MTVTVVADARLRLAKEPALPLRSGGTLPRAAFRHGHRDQSEADGNPGPPQHSADAFGHVLHNRENPEKTQAKDGDYRMLELLEEIIMTILDILGFLQ